MTIFNLHSSNLFSAEGASYLAQGGVKRNPGAKDTMSPEALKARRTKLFITVCRAFSTFPYWSIITWGYARSSLYPRLNMPRLQRLNSCQQAELNGPYPLGETAFGERQLTSLNVVSKN